MTKLNQKKFGTHQKRWQKMGKMWQEFTEPGRPSKNDIFNYNLLVGAVLKGKKNPKVIVLGSTPEIRDMLYKYSIIQGAEVICVDMTVDMYKAMSQLTENKNKKERFIKANWIDTKLPSKTADVIIGDYVICNLSDEYQDLFLNEMKRLLSNNGYFITRSMFMGNSPKFKKAEDIFKKYVDKVLNQELSIKQAVNWAAEDLIWDSWFKNKEQKQSLKYFEKEINLLKGKFKNDSIEGEIFDRFLNTWWHMKDKYWTVHLEKDGEEYINKCFTIERTLYSNDHNLTKVSPIYLLKPKI